MKIDKSVFTASKASNIPLGVPVAAKIGENEDALLVSTEVGLLNIATGCLVPPDEVTSYGEVDAELTVVPAVEDKVVRNDKWIADAWVIKNEDGDFFNGSSGYFRDYKPFWTSGLGQIYKTIAGAKSSANGCKGTVVQVSVILV